MWVPRGSRRETRSPVHIPPPTSRTSASSRLVDTPPYSSVGSGRDLTHGGALAVDSTIQSGRGLRPQHGAQPRGRALWHAKQQYPGHAHRSLPGDSTWALKSCASACGHAFPARRARVGIAPGSSPMATTTAVRCAVRMLYTSLWLELSGPGKCCSRRSCRMVYRDTARKRRNVGRP
jgi:hypothetical protein